ncbi:MAG: UMP kinase, partial [Pseudomonadota bacterium]
MQRILLKLSGESLASDLSDGSVIDPIKVELLAQNIVTVLNKRKLDLCLVIGGGNLMRGATMANDNGLTRDVADRMGMLATVFNALA